MNITKTISLAALLSVGSAASTFAAGCCGGMGAMAESNCHASTSATNTNSAGSPTLSLPAQRLMDNYIKLQSNLAKDSVDGLQDAANAMVKAIGDDKGISATIGEQAQTLAAAHDIDTAREALKPLSKSLIEYLKAQKALTGYYKEAYCPMAKAGWIQTEAELANPYMGKVMLHCGEFKS